MWYLPCKLRNIVLDDISVGHQGIVKCLERAKQAVWWPNITIHVKDRVAKCEVCCIFLLNKPKPMIVADFPDCLWQVLGTDLFHFKGCGYLLVVDGFA